VSSCLRVGLFLSICLLADGAGDTALLKWTYRQDQVQVPVLQGLDHKAYLPLLETANFYGIQVDFDPLKRRVTLSKGRSKAKLVLSQELLLSGDPESPLPIDPVEMVQGQLAVPVGSAGDLVAAVLNLNVRYLPEEGTLLAGGIQLEEIRREILAQAAPPSPTPVSKPAPVTQASAPSPAPTSPVLAPAPPIGRKPGLNQIYQVRRIIIDAGHGGHDSGAKGRAFGTLEKQATLDIAAKITERLEKRGEMVVLMSRKNDRYVALKERTQFANRHGGDLFVSIHCNSNPNRKVAGTEIYYYNAQASNKLASLSALRENAGEDYTPMILFDLNNRSYRRRSQYLAETMTESIHRKLKQHRRNPQRGPFYVLGAVEMPSILIETAFLSNKEEEVKLRDPYWRDQIAKAIAEGILDYRDFVERIDGNRQARK
jgi:N-acetylmuramoyl-L-alanine amidase